MLLHPREVSAPGELVVAHVQAAKAGLDEDRQSELARSMLASAPETSSRVWSFLSAVRASAFAAGTGITAEVNSDPAFGLDPFIPRMSTQAPQRSR